MKEEAYYKMTHTLTLHVASTLSRGNPDMNFCYISGTGTDSSEQGRSMWALIYTHPTTVLHLPQKRKGVFAPFPINIFVTPHRTPNLYTVSVLYTCPGSSTVVGKAGLLGESG